MATKKNQDDFEGLSAFDIATGVGTSAATGAATGASVAGPWGALAGGLIGGAVGGVKSYSQQQALKDAYEQQQDLDRQLGQSSLVDAYQTDAALRSGAQLQSAQQGAQQRAAQMGLTPAAALGLERQFTQDQAQQSAYDRASGFSAAAQAERARRAAVLGEFETAQGLANNATEGLAASDAELANLTRAASYLGEMNRGANAPGPATPMTDQFQPPTYAGLQDTDPGQMSQRVSMNDPSSTRIQLPGVQQSTIQATQPYFDFKSGTAFTQAQEAGVDPAFIEAAKVLQTADPQSPEWKNAYALLHGDQPTFTPGRRP